MSNFQSIIDDLIDQDESDFQYPEETPEVIQYPINLLDNSTLAILNEAIQAELFASSLYKHLANHCQRLGYFGSNKYFLTESADELTHYQLIVNFINDLSIVATVPSIPQPNCQISCLYDALLEAYKAEYELGMKYDKWYSLITCNMTKQFLLQFLEIQRKSIGEYSDLLNRFKLIQDNTSGILLFDQELGAI